MEALQHLIVCAVGDQRVALPLASVDRIVQAVAIRPLPGAPDSVAGIVNIRGEILPVINLRKQYGLPDRGVELTDELVIVVTQSRKVALLVDSTEFITCATEAMTPVEGIVAGLPRIQDVVKHQDGLILLHNIHLLLSNQEEELLNQALKESGGAA